MEENPEHTVSAFSCTVCGSIFGIAAKKPLWVKGISNRNSMFTHAGVSFQWHHLTLKFNFAKGKKFTL